MILRKLGCLGGVILASLLLGCFHPTPYKRQSGELGSAGYFDKKLTKDIYHVWADVNEFTVAGAASQFTLRRSAELTLENGFRYFVVLTQENQASLFSDLDPGYPRLIFNGHVIRFLPSAEPGAIDALAAIKETDAVAGRRLSVKARWARVRF
jgi:hypothetical protein